MASPTRQRVRGRRNGRQVISGFFSIKEVTLGVIWRYRLSHYPVTSTRGCSSKRVCSEVDVTSLEYVHRTLSLFAAIL